MGIAIVGLGVFAFAAVVAIYGGLVLWVLWGWFMVPLGLPQIGVAWAIGLSAVAALLVPTIPPAPEGKGADHMAQVLLKPALALLVGFVAKQFM